MSTSAISNFFSSFLTTFKAQSQSKFSIFAKFAEPYELYISYVGLLTMALIPIYFGSRASLVHAKSGPKGGAERVSSSDAYWFPVIGSGVLVGFYLLFKYFNQEYINYLLTAYFSMFGVASLVNLLDSMISPSLPATISKLFEHTVKVHKTGEIEPVLDFIFNAPRIGYSILSLIFMGLYVYSKHWTTNNVLGLAFSLSAISLMHLDTFMTGIILLSGLFFYDIFWVFKTDVMVTVAKSFDVPVKLLMPKSVTEYAMARPIHMALLGLGDIVIPGVFIALCLRFDDHLATTLKKPTRISYFTTCFIAYILGLIATVTVMHIFKAAQPALLYLSPACISAALIAALVNGQLKDFFAYSTEEPSATAPSKKTFVTKKKKETVSEEEVSPKEENSEEQPLTSTPRKRRQQKD
jgi:minor histocompatibility antigen H13